MPTRPTPPTSDEDLAYLSATDAITLFRAHALSPVELLDALIRRAESVNQSVNAFSETLFDEARDQAKAAEATYVYDPDAARPLEGVPVVLKDEVWLEGRRQSEGSLAFKDEVATSTAPFARRILEAGAVLHARSTTPEFCVVPYTHSRLWGVTPSPWDLTAASGGSSGGSGASLASGTTTLATGSDIGGSIRIPAAYCGVVGFKPSFGRIPDVSPWNLDRYCQNGPMARTVADASLLFSVMQGPHPEDIATLRPGLDVPSEYSGIRGRRVALCVTLGDWEVDADVAANTRQAAEALRAAGAVMDEVTLPWTWEQVIGAAGPHWGSIMGEEPRRHVAGKYDLLNDYTVEFLEKTQHGVYADSVPEGIARENAFYEPVARLFAEYDVLVCPTVAAAKLEAGNAYIGTGPVVNGTQLAEVNQAVMTVPFNILGRCPVVSLPSGFTRDGFPTSVQVVGHTYDDVTALQFAAALERELPRMYAADTRPKL